MNENDLPSKNQSAYRQFHSCESTLLRFVNDLLDGMEYQEVTALIAIDLSAAFDTVDHDILINVLRTQYFDIIPPNISVFGFADDHTAIIRFKPTSAEEEKAAIHELQQCEVIINDWMND